MLGLIRTRPSRLRGRAGKLIKRKAFVSSHEQCTMAGLDWWHVNIQPWELRFGRKSAGQHRAKGVLGYLHKSPPRIDFNDILGIKEIMTFPVTDTLNWTPDLGPLAKV